MPNRVARLLCAATLITVSLAGCGQGSDDSVARCSDLENQVKAAAQRASRAVSDFNGYTGGFNISSATTEGRRLGEQARQAMLTFLHLVTDSPECFTETQVAEAESLLTNWEQPGAVPAATATPDTGNLDRWWLEN